MPPTSLDLTTIKQGLSKKSTEQLSDIITFNQEDYKPEVIELIKEMLLERGLEQSKIDELNKEYQDIIRKTSSSVKTQQRTTRIPKILMWILYLMGLMLANYIYKEFQKGMLSNIIHSSK